MSDVDAVMMMELEKKITNRIREQVHLCVHGFVKGQPLTYTTDGYVDTMNIHTALTYDMSFSVKERILNDPSFINAIRDKLLNDYTFIHRLKQALKDLP